MVTYKEITEHVIIVKENKGLFCSYFSDNFVDSMVFFKVLNALNLIIFLFFRMIIKWNAVNIS